MAETVGFAECQLTGELAGPILALADEGQEAVLRQRQVSGGPLQHPGEAGRG